MLVQMVHLNVTSNNKLNSHRMNVWNISLLIRMQICRINYNHHIESNGYNWIELQIYISGIRILRDYFQTLRDYFRSFTQNQK